LLEQMQIDLEPAWPWSIPILGPIALAAIVFLLVAFTIWAYLGASRTTWRRIATILALRLGAFTVVVLAMLRPSIATTRLEGVEGSKLIAIFDSSASMKIEDAPEEAARWQHVKKAWTSPNVQARLRRLADEQKLDIVTYLGTDDLRRGDLGEPTGKRTDVGQWMHQLWQTHGHERHVRGILLFSDGADNGSKFSAVEKARPWRGSAPIHVFGIGDAAKDIGLTSIRVADDKPVPVKSKFGIKALAQAPGFDKADIEVNVTMKDVATEKVHIVAKMPKFRINKEKDQWIELKGDAPDLPGEYLLSLKIAPLADEANKENNEISTFVQVVKEKVNVLWVDRPRVYEAQFAIRYGLAPEERFAVYYFTPPVEGKADPLKFYEFDRRPYDVIVIGDISASQFCLGTPTFFDEINRLVKTRKTGLLMLGGAETFGAGSWHMHSALMELLPTRFDESASYGRGVTQVTPTKGDSSGYPFIRLLSDAKANDELWTSQFKPLKGMSNLGKPAQGSTILLQADSGDPALVVTQSGQGRVAVFGADSTWDAWQQSPEAAIGYEQFWRRLVVWLTWQKDQQEPLWVKLDKRRVNHEAGESLQFSFGLRDKAGNAVPDATFEGKVIRSPRPSGGEGPGVRETEFPVRLTHKDRGTFEAAKEPGEYQLVMKAKSKDLQAESTPTRFFIVAEDVESMPPLADQQLLRGIADASEGQYHQAGEAALAQVLDALRDQLGKESRHKTIRWPDWKRVPTSDQARDQIVGMWNSFALLGLALFIGLLTLEWSLRRWWGLV